MGTRKKARNGEGSFRIVRDKWNYRFTYTNEFGERKVKGFTAITQEECLILAENFLEKNELAKSGINLDLTIPELLHEKFDNDFKKNYTAEQGYDRNLQTLKIIEAHPIANVPIVDITTGQMEKFLQKITSYSDNVIKKVYQQMKMAFKIAKERGLIEKNILEIYDLRRPNSSKRTKEVKGFTIEEQKRFTNALAEYKVKYRHPDFRLQMLIELNSGMRMGEINAMKPADIDWNRNVIHVRRTVSKGLGGRLFINDTTKTENGMRDVPISSHLEPLLRQAINNMKDNPEGVIFYDYTGEKIISTERVNAQFRSILKKADISPRGQHALRHTFATRCIESGIPAVVLKNWMGHSDIHMTLDVYADVFSSMNNDAINKLSEHLKDVR